MATNAALLTGLATAAAALALFAIMADRRDAAELKEGSTFGERDADLWWQRLDEAPGPHRQSQILAAWRRGQFRPIVWRDVQSIGAGPRAGWAASIPVTADALMVGTGRPSVTANTLRTIARESGHEMLTQHVARLAWEQADVKNPPMTGRRLWGDAVPWYDDGTMMLASRYRQYDAALNRDLAAHGARVSDLIGNPGKDWIQTSGGAMPNFGWFQADGAPTQSPGYAHGHDYDDYSQKARLMGGTIRVRRPDGGVATYSTRAAMRDPFLAPLLTGAEGAYS